MIDDQDMAIRQANQPISIEAPTEHERAEIARLNDELRQRPGARCVFTHGVMAMLVEGAKDEGDAQCRRIVGQRALLTQIANCVPAEGDDPYGERDFAAIVYNDAKIFCKIDYFEADSERMYGSAEPWNAEKTDRVMTVMLADEY